MWSNSIRTAVFAAILIEYLSSRTLLSIAQSAEILGSEFYIFSIPLTNYIFIPVPVTADWSDRMALPAEDYLHALISLVNELVCPSIVYPLPRLIDAFPVPISC